MGQEEMPHEFFATLRSRERVSILDANSGREMKMKLLTIALALSILPAYASARVERKTRAAKKAYRSSGTATRRTGRLRRRYRAFRGHLRFSRSRSRFHPGAKRYRSTARYARREPATEISPQRAEQIQEALVQAGDLHETPTGHWDTETREAMKQYQSSNGFQPTGLPDAKSLMKLGLGPHPLPADLDPKAVTQPSSANAQPGKAIVPNTTR